MFLTKKLEQTGDLFLRSGLKQNQIAHEIINFPCISERVFWKKHFTNRIRKIKITKLVGRIDGIPDLQINWRRFRLVSSFSIFYFILNFLNSTDKAPEFIERNFKNIFNCKTHLY